MFISTWKVATRLRRFAESFPAILSVRDRSARPAAPLTDPWSRVDCFVGTRAVPQHALRARELAGENGRLAITLIGQSGPRLVQRVAVLVEGLGSATHEAALLLLTLAHDHGSEATRRAAREGLDRLSGDANPAEPDLWEWGVGA